MDAHVFEDGTMVSAADITAGIDGALTVAARLRGVVAAQLIQLPMAYAPEPPFDAGTLERAPPLVLERTKAAAPEITARRTDTARQVQERLGL